MRTWTGLALLGTLLAAAGARRAADAAATIDVTDAQVAAGNAPQQGTVVVDAAAPAATPPALPALGSLGTLGTMDGGVPAFPGGGSGADGFRATDSVSLPGGTYEYAWYEVLPGVTVTYEGPVVLRTTGHVALRGSVFTQGADRTITFECGGEFRLGGDAGGGVYTNGADADITLDVGGGLVTPPAETTAPSEVRAFTGDVVVLARGAGAGSYAVDLRSTSFDGTTVEIASSTGVRGDFAYVYGDDRVRIDAFGGDVELSRAEVAASAGPIDVRASGAVRLPVGRLHATRGDTTVTAYGGDLRLADGGYCYAYENGSVRLRAGGSVLLEDGGLALVADGTGTLELSAFGGDVALRPALLAYSGSSTIHQGTGPTLITASASVRSDGTFVSSGGDVTIRALAGDVVLDAYAEATTPGPLDVGASNVVRAGDATAGSRFRGGSVRLFGTQVRLHGSDVSAEVSTAQLLGTVAVAGRGTIQGTTGVTIASTAGAVILDGATVLTRSGEDVRSGDVGVFSFGGANGSITARGATIRSGDNDVRSGDVALRIHTPFAPKVTAYLLPASVTVKLGTGRGAGLRASGTIGFPSGWTEPEDGATLPLEVTLGTRVLVRDVHARTGRPLEHRTATEQVRVTPPRSGSSEGTFTLRVDGDLTGDVPADGTLALRLLVGDVDAAGSVVLTAGKFKLGKGEVLEPNVYPVKVAATLRGRGRDTLSLSLGFVPGEETPGEMPDLTLRFGPYFCIVAAEDFAATTPGKFVARRPPSAPGLTSVTVDFVRGSVVVAGRNFDLGTFGDGPSVAVPITLGLGPADVRTLDVEASRRGAKLSY